MKLIIDSENIDFQLEQEKNLWDILKSIENYLNKYNRHIIKAVMNKNFELDIDNKENLTGFTVDKIKDLCITSETPLDSALNSLVDIKTYAERVLNLIDNNPDKIAEEKTEAIGGLSWLINGSMGAVYTLGINSQIIYYKSTFLKDFLARATNISKKVEEHQDNDEQFIEIFKEDVKPLLEEFREFINVIGIRIYFNILYNEDLEKFKSKAKELFDINISSINSLKSNIDEIKNNILSDKDSISIPTGQNLIKLLFIIINDIIFSSKVIGIELEDIGTKNENTDAFAFSKDIKDKLANLEVSLVKNKKKEEFAKSLDDGDFEGIFDNTLYILEEMKKKMDGK